MFGCPAAWAAGSDVNPSQSQTQAKSTAEIKPNDVDLIIKRAADFAARGDGVNAALEYRRAFEAAPLSQIAVHGFVQQILRLGAAPMQIKQLSKRLATTPGDLAARLLLAELLFSEARYDDALDQYQLVLIVAPDNLLARRGAAEAWFALGYFNRAEELFAQLAGHIPAAQSLAMQARLLVAVEQPEAALRLLQEQESIVERDPLALLAQADAYRALGQSTTEERATLEKALASSSHEDAQEEALEKLMRVALEMDDKEAVARTAGQLLTIDPGNPVGALALSLAEVTAPPPAAASPARFNAEAQATTAARRAGLDQSAGEAMLFLNRPELALPLLRRALETRADSPRLSLALGKALLRVKEADGAPAAFGSVVIKGSRPDALLGLAQAEILRRKPERALAIYGSVLRLDPSNFQGLLGQAEAHRLMRNNELAVPLLADLVRRAPSSRAINSRLRETLSTLGRAYKTTPSATARRAIDALGTSVATSWEAGILPLTEPLLETRDTVRVRVIGRPRLNAEARLDEDGFVQLPFLKQAVNARCLTERELSAEIFKRGEAELTGAIVEASIATYGRGALTVVGAVYRPGSFNVRTALDLRAGLMLASGPTARAGSSVYVVRGACEPQQPAANINQVEIYERRAVEEGNIKLPRLLRAGDIVIVPRNDEVLITGAVARPGMFAAPDQLTLLEAVRRRGGTLPGAGSDKVRLLQLLPDGVTRQQFIINLDEIAQQRTGDVLLEPGDVVEVPSSDVRQVMRSNKMLRHADADTPAQITTSAPRQGTITSKPRASGGEKKNE